MFNILFIGYTFGIVFFLSPVLLGPKSWVQRVAFFWAQGVTLLARLVLGISFEVRGILPDTPMLVASKHQSTLETVLLYYIFKNPVFLLKKELLSIPLMGLFWKKLGMIPLERQKGHFPFKSISHNIKKTLDHEQSFVIIFPEGTRSAVGATTHYRAGVSLIYDKIQAPVLPIALNTGVFWPRRAFLKRPGKAVLQLMPIIPPGLDPKDFRAQLEEVIEHQTHLLVQEATCAIQE